MEEIGKIYSLRSLFSEEEKEEHKQCKPGTGAINKFNELIGGKIEKLIKDLNYTNMWEVEKAEDDNLDTSYYIKYVLNTGRHRRPINRISTTGHIYVCGDEELVKFLSDYQ